MVCLVLWCLWLIFDFGSVGVCVSEEEADDEAVGLQKEKREKKKRSRIRNY